MAEALPTLPGYEFLRHVGVGGMGEVFEARQVRLNRRVAVKRLRSDKADKDHSGFKAWNARIKREAILLAAINHPNIAIVHDVIDDLGAIHLIMEFVDGLSLREALVPGGIPLPHALDIACQLARGLRAAHAADVIHRDIKPANIHVTSGNVVKILDFGLARRNSSEATTCELHSSADAAATTALRTRPGIFVGTPGYAAPEQVLGEYVDQRADIFSFGCVFFEMLCGQRPFDPRGGAGPAVVLHASVNWSLLAAVPPSIVQLLRGCLATQRTNRIPSIAEVLPLIEATSPVTKPLQAAVPSAAANHLPLPATTFVGRAGELKNILELLTAARLVTLVGLGGVGKTRLALQAASAFSRTTVPNPTTLATYFLRADLLTTPRQLVQALARILHLAPKPGGSLIEQVIEFIAPRRVLLVLDACEQLLPAQRATLERLLAACLDLTILATSRERLNIPGEHVLAVGPLAAADDAAPPSRTGARSPQQLLHTAALSDAARLFLTRAREAWPPLQSSDLDHPIVESICRRVGGFPLGIELAAACADLLTFQEISQRLTLSLSSLPSASHDRSLNSVVEWGYQRLTAEQQSVLRRLCTFASDFPLAAAERLCDDQPLDAAAGGEDAAPRQSPVLPIHSTSLLDILGALVRKSLLIRRTNAPAVPHPDLRSRYALLDPVREFAAAEARSSADGRDELGRAQRRMIAWAIESTELADDALEGKDQGLHVERLHSDYASIRGALAAACTPAITPAAIRLTAALERFWYRARLTQEASEWVDSILVEPLPDATDPLLIARAMKTAGVVAGLRLDRTAALHWYQCGLDRIAGAHAPPHEVLRARLFNNIGLVCSELGMPTDARSAFQAALDACDRAGDDRVRSHTQLNLGSLEKRHGDRALAHRLLASAASTFARHGDALREGVAAFNLAGLLYGDGDFPGSLARIEQAIDAALTARDESGRAFCALAAATVSARAGYPAAARPLFDFAFLRCNELKLPTTIFKDEDLKLAACNGSASAVCSSDPVASRSDLSLRIASITAKALGR